MISRNDPCFCGSGKKWKKCHYPEQPQPVGDDLAALYKKKYGIILKTPEQMKGIREACKFAAKVLKACCDAAKPGVTTNEIDAISAKMHKERKAIPAALHYGDPPFPKGICTSLNDIVCHGIPDDRPLVKGDILNIDVASIVDGYYGDNSAMVVVGGETTPEKQKTVDVAYGAMMAGIEILRPGLMVCEIGNAIADYATSRGCSVVYQFVSHGVGLDFHEAPQISHTYNQTQIPLAEGMTFTVEPMINYGKPECTISREDGWTAPTIDGLPSAQWEHTVYITKNGYEILTK